MMSELEIITNKNISRLQQIGQRLSDIYKVAFAGSPWFEVSRCINSSCDVSFSSEQPGCNCSKCQQLLVDAYDKDNLISGWKQVLRDDGLIEVAYIGDIPQRATIVRPTDPTELYKRKYKNLPDMKEWLKTTLPDELVWIEDTFADRTVKRNGNLSGRGATLQRVTDYYGDLQIATRTLSEAIVASTLRDLRSSTAVYIGTNRVGTSIVNNYLNNPGYDLPTVPDRRTLLRVSNIGARYETK